MRLVVKDVQQHPLSSYHFPGTMLLRNGKINDKLDESFEKGQKENHFPQHPPKVMAFGHQLLETSRNASGGVPG